MRILSGGRVTFIRLAGVLLAASLFSLSASAQSTVPVRPLRGWIKPAHLPPVTQPAGPVAQNPALAGIVTFNAAPAGRLSSIRQVRGVVLPKSRVGARFMKLLSESTNASGPWTVTPAAPVFGDILRMRVWASNGATIVEEFTDPNDPGLIFQNDESSVPIKIQLNVKVVGGKTYVIDAGLNALQWSGTGTCTVLLAGPGGQQQTVPCPPAIDSHVLFAYVAGASGYADFNLSITPNAMGVFSSFTVSQLN